MPGEYIQSKLFDLKRRTFFGQFSFVTTKTVRILFFFFFFFLKSVLGEMHIYQKRKMIRLIPRKLLMSTLPSESLVTSPFFLTVASQPVRTMQLSGCRGGYFENIRQFPKLNKLSISIIVVNYNN